MPNISKYEQDKRWAQDDIQWYSDRFGKKRPDWMPEPEMYLFVLNMIDHAHEFFDEIPREMLNMNEHWIPLGIIGTLEWLHKSLWWFFEYTSFRRTNLQYTQYFVYEEEYEWNPEKLIVCMEDPENSQLEFRYRKPGLYPQEQRSIRSHIPWFFKKFDVEPPKSMEIIDYIAYATMIWILQDGRPWMDDMEELFRCATKYAEKGQPFSYVSSWEREGALLHPMQMIHTERELGVCANDKCQNKQWCVGWYRLGDIKAHFCHSCAIKLVEMGNKPDPYDTRFDPDICGSCINTDCPYASVVKEGGHNIPLQLIEKGDRLMEQYRDHADEHGLPRQLAGQTKETIRNHFTQQLEG